MGYAISTTVRGGFDETLARSRSALAEHGFGVLTEIDLAATLKQKLGVEVPAQVILGACNPPSALEALRAEESIGLLLPCNVVVRSTGTDTTVVEAIDPTTMHVLTGNDALAPVAARVGAMLRAALASLND
ncbi:MAG TPA: DUF302 domain-containing protein [Propionicimonas sp.]|jgi:uncharacterized protein (DUF302 family)